MPREARMPFIEPLLASVEEIARRVAAGPVTTSVPAEEVRRHLAATFDLERPMPLDRLTDEVTGMLERWQVQVTHPRYFGLYNPSVAPASVLADTLVAAYNPQLAAWSHTPAANEIERFTLRAIAGRLGFDPDTTVAHFTSGGAEANLTGLLTALAGRFPDWVEGGVRGLPEGLRLYVSVEGHHSVHKAARVVGLGDGAVAAIPADPAGRLRPTALAERLAADRAAGRTPLAVVATLGTTGAGALDPLPAIAAICRDHGLWLHVDAAWAGAAALSPRLAPHLAGLPEADSLTCDAHKWLSVPMGAGMFFCRHRVAVERAFGQHTPYMPASRSAEVDDPFSHTLQWSRRFIGLKVFMTIAEAGFEGVVARIEHQTRIGECLRAALRGDGWTIANQTPLPVVCFHRPGLDSAEVVDQLHRRQIAWMSPIRIAGGPLLVRACVTSYRTTDDDVAWVVGELARIAGGRAPGPRS